MRYTAQDAIDAQDDGQPILLGYRATRQLIQQHGCEMADFIADCGSQVIYHADIVLTWLGY